jgi:creatinine amidohydrolase
LSTISVPGVPTSRRLAELRAPVVGRIVFVNGHGGNRALVNVANRELRLHYGLVSFFARPRPPGQGGGWPPNELGVGVRAGTDEPWLVLHLAPNLFDLSTVERRVPEHVAENCCVRLGGPVSFGWGTDDFDESGVIGDPKAATVERGAEPFAGAEAFCVALAEVVRFEFTVP